MTEGQSNETPKQTEPGKARSLDDLGVRLKQARASETRTAGRFSEFDKKPDTGLGLAMRIGVELVAALIVGAAVGWFLDGWLGTRPWLMLVFLLLGFCAGFLNVYRVVSGYGMAVGYNKPDGGDAGGGDQEK